jgi:hypothetical protein
MMKEAEHFEKVKRVRVQDKELEAWADAYAVSFVLSRKPWFDGLTFLQDALEKLKEQFGRQQ